MAFAASWQSLFKQQDATAETMAVPRLGIDYIRASAAEASVPLTGDPSKPLVIQQDLAQLGVAGVVWNCVRTTCIGWLQRPGSLTP